MSLFTFFDSVVIEGDGSRADVWDVCLTDEGKEGDALRFGVSDLRDGLDLFPPGLAKRAGEGADGTVRGELGDKPPLAGTAFCVVVLVGVLYLAPVGGTSPVALLFWDMTLGTSVFRARRGVLRAPPSAVTNGSLLTSLVLPSGDGLTTSFFGIGCCNRWLGPGDSGLWLVEPLVTILFGAKERGMADLVLIAACEESSGD